MSVDALRHDGDEFDYKGITLIGCRHCHGTFAAPADVCVVRVSAALAEANERADRDAEALQDTIDAWQDKCNAQRSMLRRLEWASVPGSWNTGYCDECRQEMSDGHAPGCALAALLAGA